MLSCSSKGPSENIPGKSTLVSFRPSTDLRLIFMCINLFFPADLGTKQGLLVLSPGCLAPRSGSLPPCTPPPTISCLGAAQIGKVKMKKQPRTSNAPQPHLPHVHLASRGLAPLGILWLPFPFLRNTVNSAQPVPTRLQSSLPFSCRRHRSCGALPRVFRSLLKADQAAAEKLKPGLGLETASRLPLRQASSAPGAPPGTAAGSLPPL